MLTAPPPIAFLSQVIVSAMICAVCGYGGMEFLHLKLSGI